MMLLNNTTMYEFYNVQWNLLNFPM